MRRGAVAVAAVLLLGSGCAADRAPGAAVPVTDPTPTAGVSAARQGTAAPSTRVRFEPSELVLPGGARSSVFPAQTRDGKLRVPEDVRHVGWWDGSAYAGDPFGATVIAGHVDSRDQGIGFFARLLKVEVGDVVSVRDGRHQADYRVTKRAEVARDALATDAEALGQTGAHRLVLITCGGRYRPERGGYDSNVVVTAAPVGPAR